MEEINNQVNAVNEAISIIDQIAQNTLGIAQEVVSSTNTKKFIGV